jgi:Flp pilus assembly secretin CpaC
MNKTLSCTIAVVVTLFATHAAAQAAAPKSLRLKAGHSVVLEVEQMASIAVGDPTIANINPLGDKEVLVYGQKEGTTELRVFTKKPELLVWTITVVAAGAPDTDLTPGATKTVELKVGSTVTLTQKGLARLAVGDPDVADIEVSKAGLTIKGAQVGSTTLILWYEDGKREVSEIRVTP